MKNRLIALITIIIGFLLYIGYVFLFNYHIKLNGDKNIIIDLDSDYKELGASITYRGKAINNYKIVSNVDTHKVGKYKVKYSVNDFVKTRTVIVKDKVEPNITLEGDEDYVLEYDTDYVEPGYIANDNYDGDLTKKVKTVNNINKKKLGEYIVTYDVSDSSKNKKHKSRKVKVVDSKAPKISFTNNKNRYSIVGEKIDLNDFSAVDNYDGDVTDKVNIEGNVDFDNEGVYKINYVVTDSNGNESKIERSINVQESNRSGIPVLMYHWFYDDTKGETAGTVNSHNYIAKTELEKQLDYVTSEGFYFPTWDELIKYIDGEIDLPSKSVIFTDDDCDESMFDVALPVFQKYKVPVTSFCITRKDYWLNYIGEEYLDFESHTDDLHTRRCKGSWDGAVMCSTYDEIYDDLKKSVEKVGGNTWSFAYPFGHYNDNTIKALQENDIKLAFTINSGRVKRGANKYKLPRVRISKGTSISQYQKLVN